MLRRFGPPDEGTVRTLRDRQQRAAQRCRTVPGIVVGVPQSEPRAVSGCLVVVAQPRVELDLPARDDHAVGVHIQGSGRQDALGCDAVYLAFDDQSDGSHLSGCLC